MVFLSWCLLELSGHICECFMWILHLITQRKLDNELLTLCYIIAIAYNFVHILKS